MARKQLAMFEALPSYLGGKRKLLAPIFREIARHIDVSEWPSLTFVDPFMGGGSVSLYAKARFKSVAANDLALRSALIGNAIIVNNRTKLRTADLLLFLKGVDSPDNFCVNELADVIPEFTGSVIDRGLAYADTLADGGKRAMLRLLAWRIACESRPGTSDSGSKDIVKRAMAGEINASGVTRATFSLRAPRFADLHRFATAMNGGVFLGDATFDQRDAVDFCAQTRGDVWFVDPPYCGDDRYASTYRGVDSAIARVMLPSKRSAFGKSETAEPLLEEIAMHAAENGARLIVWHNSNAIPAERHADIVRHAMGKAYIVGVDHEHGRAAMHSRDGDTGGKKSGKTEVMIVGHR